MVKPLFFDPDAPALSTDSPIPVEPSLHVTLDWIHAHGPNHVHEPGAKHVAQNDARTPRLVCPNPKPGAYYLDTRTGEYEPSRCERNTCPVCCVINSWSIAAAIKRAEPDYVLVLTQVGIAWSDTSKRLNRFFYHLAQWYPTIKYGFQVEFNPAGTGNHANVYLHTAGNENISPKTVTKCASRVGIGPVFNLKRPRPNCTTTFYEYGFKNLVDEATQDHYRELNGTRIFHTSKQGFWRDGRDGDSLTFHQAKVLARHRH
jgi:hypothetical protein